MKTKYEYMVRNIKKRSDLREKTLKGNDTIVT